MSLADPFATEDDAFLLNAAMPVSHLSPSSVSTFMRCPEQWRREYLLKQSRRSGLWGISGGAFHEARHEALKIQQAYGRECTEEELRAFYDAEWVKRMGEGAETGNDNPDDVRAAGWAMTLLYHRELGRNVVPIRQEFGATGHVPGVPVVVYGRIDVETAEEGIDTKTGKQLFHKLKPEHLVQGCIYVWLLRKPFRWHSVSQKPAATTNDMLRLEPRPRVLHAAESYVRDAYDGIRHLLDTRGPDNEWPGNGPASGVCNYCSFRASCLFSVV